MPRITIIETGLVPPHLRPRHGSYPDMFARMIGTNAGTVTFDVVSVAKGEALPDPESVQAILITGSAAGVYDGLEWIAPLEAFVRAVDAQRKPMVGVCFGHQLIAQALGGVVRKSEKGWGIGRHVYRVTPDNKVIDGDELAIICSHQDQVIEPPAGARTILSSAFTPYAGLLYASGSTMSVQPHPEFDVELGHALCDLRTGNAPDSVVATARASLAEPLDSATLGGAITRFVSR
jgi:GMP synthase-like glutamine amidotransferase